MKTILVTGSGGNLGKAVVKEFLSLGYNVVGTVAHHDTVSEVVNEPGFESLTVDLANEEASQKLMDYVVSKYGDVDAAVLTAGGFTMGKIVDTKTSDIAKQFKLNFETTYNIARPVFARMLKQNSGRIFMIGSRAGSAMRHSKGVAAYGLSKSLIFRLSELMNEEAKEHNVVTSVVVPSIIDTPQNRASMPDADFSKWVKPETIAEVISFYCSEKAEVLREPVIKVYGNS